jgi:hypothetical protein
LQQNSAQKESYIAAPTPRDLENVRSFTDDQRGYEDNMASIWRFVLWAMGDPHICDQQPVLQDGKQGVLVAKVLQRHSWIKVAQQFNLAGKADVNRCLQSALGQLLAIVSVGG